MTYGKDIGKKFYEDGTVRHYPGNTVVADIVPGCSAYDVMLQLRQMLIDRGLAQYFVLLPADSYHMTLIRGLNDQVRTDAYWPASLSKDTPMTQVDDYISTAIEKAGLPGPVRMRFDRVNVSASCCTVRLVPADEAQAQLLQQFRKPHYRIVQFAGGGGKGVWENIGGVVGFGLYLIYGNSDRHHIFKAHVYLNRLLGV